MSQSESRLTVAFVAPLIVFLVISCFEPKFSGDDRFSRTSASRLSGGPAVDEGQDAEWTLSKSAVAKAQRYLVFNWIKLVVVGGLLIYFVPVYRQYLPMSGSGLAILVGVIGFLLWIGLCQAGIEQRVAASLGWAQQVTATRSHFNPFVAFSTPAGLTLFLFARLAMLVVVVPLAEELFLRGFLLRYLQNPDWTRQAFTGLGFWPLAAGTLYGIATHPAEALAAAAWFSLVTWLMVRTGSFWNCVLAHAVTNGLLGVYVLMFSQWQLW